MTTRAARGARAWAVLKSEGPLAVARRAWEAVFEVRRQILLVADAAKAGMADDVAGLSWEVISDASRLVDPELDYSPRLARESEAWLAQGDWCLAGVESGLVVTYLWVATRVRQLPRCTWAIEPGSAFVYKTFTRPSCRGRGLNRAALREACRRIAVSGRRRVFIDVSDANAASVRAIRSAGFEDAARFAIIRVGRYRRAVVPRHVRALVSGKGRETSDVR